jgi:hypothetical protein
MGLEDFKKASNPFFVPFSNGFLTEFEKFHCKRSGFRSVEGGKGVVVSSFPESLDCVAMAKVSREKRDLA